jgi:ABC-2 type transport system permease protein
MRAALTILAKDLRLRVRDRSAFVVGIVAPFGLAFILNLVTGGFGDDFSATYGVVDHDGGEIAAGFTEVVEGLGDDFEVTTGLGEDAARHDVDDGELDAVFVIPEGFSASVTSTDAAAELRVIGSVDSPIGTSVATAIAEGFTARLEATRLSVGVAALAECPDVTGSAEPRPCAGGGGVGQEQSIDELVASAQQQAPPVAVGESTATSRQLDGTTYLMAGMAVFFVFFMVQFGVVGLLEEGRDGTLARLLAAPIPRSAVILAKALTSLVLGIVGLSVLAVGSTLLMGADWGPPLAVAALVVAVTLAAVSLVGVVAGLVKTAEQASGIQSVIATVLGMLGGSFFPVTQGGGLLAAVSAITPHYWFLRGLGEAQAGGLASAVPAVGALLAFALVVGGVGAVLLQRKVEP